MGQRDADGAVAVVAHGGTTVARAASKGGVNAEGQFATTRPCGVRSVLALHICYHRRSTLKANDGRILRRSSSGQAAHTFYGYGDYARNWFVGMEEGGGNSVVEIEQRPERWVESGEQETVDLVDPDCDLETTPFFCKKAKIQPTWNKLIRILLSSQGSVPTTEQVRQYQRSSLGRHGGENCLVELLPLPSPSMRHWIYGNNSKLEYLKNRKTYQEHCLPWARRTSQTKDCRASPRCCYLLWIQLSRTLAPNCRRRL